MEQLVLISWLNDYIFCPASVYFHCMYAGVERKMFQDVSQIAGTCAHKNVDLGMYSTKKSVLSGIKVYSEKLGVIGKIDIFDAEKSLLIERKNQIKNIYDGYVFQLYAQCYCLREMGYSVRRIELRSVVDNRTYKVLLPENDQIMSQKFFGTLEAIKAFDIHAFVQTNLSKCARCIYSPICGGINA